MLKVCLPSSDDCCTVGFVTPCCFPTFEDVATWSAEPAFGGRSTERIENDRTRQNVLESHWFLLQIGVAIKLNVWCVFGYAVERGLSLIMFGQCESRYVYSGNFDTCSWFSSTSYIEFTFMQIHRYSGGIAPLDAYFTGWGVCSWGFKAIMLKVCEKLVA